MTRSVLSIERNVATVTQKLLELLRVPVTREFISDLKLRPEFPTLLAVSNALLELHVANMVIQLPAEQLEEITYPAIAQLREDGGTFVIITKVENGTVHYLGDKLQVIRASLGEFVKTWTGILLVAEPDEKSSEPQHIEKRNLEVLSTIRVATLATLSGLILLSLIYFEPVFAAPLIFNVIGIVLCVTLLMQASGQHNRLSEALCKPNSKTDCSQVIQSSVGKIYGNISLSEAGVLFFAGGLFSNILFSLTGSSVFNPYIFLFFVSSLPFTAFSIYYQWRVVKTWCALCMAVVALLWIGTVYYGINYPSYRFDSLQLRSAFLGYSIPLVIWLMIRSSIHNAQAVPLLKKSLYKFSKNQNVFDILSQQRQLISGSFVNDVILGNPEAANVITLVTSTTCGPCVYAHHQIESWLSQFDEDLKVIVRFAVNPSENGSVRNSVAGNLISLALKGDAGKLRQAIASWYKTERVEIKEWLTSVPPDLHPDTEKHFIDHHRWCEENNITATPTIFFNGRQIPQEYTLKDFEHILRMKLNENV